MTPMPSAFLHTCWFPVLIIFMTCCVTQNVRAPTRNFMRIWLILSACACGSARACACVFVCVGGKLNSELRAKFLHFFIVKGFKSLSDMLAQLKKQNKTITLEPRASDFFLLTLTLRLILLYLRRGGRSVCHGSHFKLHLHLHRADYILNRRCCFNS